MTESPGPTDHCSLGYIKGKFEAYHSSFATRLAIDEFADKYDSSRRTANYIYVQLGHKSIKDNDQGRTLVRTILGLGGKITRVDFCLDLPCPFDFKAYKERMDIAYESQSMGFKLGLPQLYTSLEGNTVYIGKRGSPRYFRVYDKAAEIKAKAKVDIEMSLTRYEIECKRSVVMPYLALFMEGNTKAIVDDMAYRYCLPELSNNPKRILPTETDAGLSSVWSFVHRYRRILREAYTTDKDLFIETIGER